MKRSWGNGHRGRMGIQGRASTRAVTLAAMLLAALVVLCSGIAVASQDEAPVRGSGPGDSLTAGQPPVELEGKRTATSDTFRLPDGRRETQIFADPINYQTSTGQWAPIEEGLEEQPDGTGLTNGANSFDVTLPDRLGAAPVRLSVGKSWVASRLLGPESESAQLEGGAATYEADGAGVNFELSGLANGLKEDIEVADPSQPSAFKFELTASAEVTPTLLPDGSVAFRDETGNEVAQLPAPTVADSSPGQPEISKAVHYALEPRGSGAWLLSVEVDPEWIAQPGRTWPLIIDPTITIESPSLDCTISGTAGSNGTGLCGSKGQKELFAAYHPGTTDEWKRSLLRFQLPTHEGTVIPANAYVASATVGLYASSAAVNTAGAELREATRLWTSEATWLKYNHETLSLWTNEGGDYNAEGGEVKTSERGSAPGWWNFNTTGVVRKMLGKGATNYGLLLKLIDDHSRECSGSTCTQRSLAFESSAAANPTLRPKLTITYYTPASSDSKVTSPSEGSHSARRFKLQAGWSHAGVTGAYFQYKAAAGWTDVPVSALTDKSGNSVAKWPLPIEAGVHQSEPVFWDATSPANPGIGSEVQIRAILVGAPEADGYTQPAKAILDRTKGGPHDATAGVGPASVDLLTGNATVARTDVSIPGFGSSLEFSRSIGSREAPTSSKTSVLGQGWTPAATVEEAGGAEWRSVRDVIPSAEELEEGYGEYALLTDLEGYEYAFELSGGVFQTPPELTGIVLTRTETGFVLADPSGNRTTFAVGATASEYLPVSISQTGGSANSTQMVYQLKEGVKRLTMIIAPSATGVSCNQENASYTLGCRSLRLNYVGPDHWGGSGTLGERLSSITYYGPASASKNGNWEVAKYAYNSEGRMTEEWDPRITPNLKETYSYETAGQLHTITPPGQEPWTLEYKALAGDEGATGRLSSVKRASLLSSPSVAQTTVVYGVPLSGSSVPDMSGGAVAKWGQQVTPTDATAIFPPDQVPTSSPPSSYSRATIDYLNAEGYAVNTSTPSGAGTSSPSITTAETDEFGNVVRELSPQNRLRALAAGTEAEKIAKSHELETKRFYSADGTEMLEELGPMHQVRLESGAIKAARLHTTIQYDKGWPGTGVKPRLPTQVTTGASIPKEGEDADVHVSRTTYDWNLRQPLETIDDPGGEGHLELKSRFAYDPNSGLPTERSLPGHPEGGDAHTTKTLYYSAGTESPDPACQSKPAWANLACKITPAKQPETAGLPELLVRQFVSYNQLGEPLEVIESPGGKASNIRKATTSYDTAGRELTKKVEGGGTETPQTKTLYSS